MKAKMNPKPKIVVYLGEAIMGPERYFMWCSMKRIASDSEAHENVSDYSQLKESAKIHVTENGTTYEISIALEYGIVLGQWMHMLHIRRPAVVTGIMEGCYSK